MLRVWRGSSGGMAASTRQRYRRTRRIGGGMVALA